MLKWQIHSRHLCHVVVSSLSQRGPALLHVSSYRTKTTNTATAATSFSSSWRDSLGALAERTKTSVTISVASSVLQAQEKLALKRSLDARLDAFTGVFSDMEANALHKWAQALCLELGFRLPADAVLTGVRSIVPVLLTNAPTLFFRSIDMPGTMSIVQHHLFMGADTAKTITVQRAREALKDEKQRQVLADALHAAGPSELAQKLDELDQTAFAPHTLAPLTRTLFALRQASKGPGA